eukprot:1199446-Pyramimonas_sp.AAC.1
MYNMVCEDPPRSGGASLEANTLPAQAGPSWGSGKSTKPDKSLFANTLLAQTGPPWRSGRGVSR